jgi:hypothetical protein
MPTQLSTTDASFQQQAAEQGRSCGDCPAHLRGLFQNPSDGEARVSRLTSSPGPVVTSGASWPG